MFPLPGSRRFTNCHFEQCNELRARQNILALSWIGLK